MTELKKKFRGPQHKLATSEDLESLARTRVHPPQVRGRPPGEG